MSVRLSCPSCNTAFALPALPDDRRATCPRCGDAFPVRTFTEVAEPEAASPADAPHTPPRSRGLSAGWALVVVLLMGVVGLGVGVWMYQGRPRANDEPEQRKPEVVLAPAELSGLGYLPADTNVAFAAQPGPVIAYAARHNRDPRDLLVKAGIPVQLLDAVSNTGLTLAQIDHLAGGTCFGDGVFEMRFALVLVLHRPIADEDTFLDKLKAKPLPGPRERHEAEFANLPVKMTLAKVSPTVWVFGADAKKDMEAADRGGYGAGGKQFPTGLVEMITQRVPPDAAAWAATDDGAWADKPGVKLLVLLLKKGEWLAPMARGRAVAASLSLGDDPRLRLFVKAADAETGQKLRDYFKEKAATDEKVRHGGGGELAFYDAPVDPADSFATLERFLRDAGKK